MKKNIENSDMPMSSPTTLDARSVRSRKIQNGSSGWRARDSMTMKAASSAADTASRPIVCVEPQPALSASTSA